MPLFQLAIGAGSGTVTSVGLTAPSSILAVTGSPVTTAGVLALALVAQTANFVLAGPATGSPADPAFRALVAADIPDLSSVYQPLSAKLTAFAALADSAGFLKNDGAGVYSWAAAGGDFSGPASATDNAIVRFDGTTGKLGQNSLAILDDSGNLAIAALTITTGSNPAVIVNKTGSGPANILVQLAGADAATWGVANGAGQGVAGSVAGDFFIKPVAGAVHLSTDDGTTVGFRVKATNVIQFPAYGAGTLRADGSGNITAASSGAGTGDFNGPASSTDNAVVRFDGTTGKLGQDSLLLVADSGNTTVSGSDGSGAAFGFSATNTNTAGRASVSVTNDSGDEAGISSYGSAFASAGLQRAALIYGSRNLFVLSDGGVSSGGSNTLQFITGGYANSASLTIAAGNPGLVTIAGNLTVSGYITSGAHVSNPSGDGVFSVNSTNNASRAQIIFNTLDSGGTARPFGLYCSPQTTTVASFLALSADNLSYHIKLFGSGAVQFAAYSAGVLVTDSSGNITAATSGVGTGTVTSVSLTAPAFLTVGGSPVTTSGTLALTLATQIANTVFAGPTTGAAAAPTFRALVAADFPSIPATTFTMATARILGRTTAGTGAVEELTAGTSLSLSSGSLNTIQGIRTSDTPQFTSLGLGVAASVALDVVGAGRFAVAAGGTAITLNASTGTANTGMNITWQRGATSKWNLGTGISLGADAFELYDRSNAVSVLSIVQGSGNMTLTGNVTTASIIAATGASAGMAVSIPAGGGGLTLNASTGTANTGMNVTWQRGGSSKWNLGTAISLGADSFELYDRANAVSAFSIAAATSVALFAGSVGIGGAPGSSGSFRFLTVTGGSTSQGGVLQTQVSDASVIGTLLTTNAGVFVNAQTSNPLFLSTNNTTRLTITAAGDVGIGTTSPGSFGSLRFFTVQGGSATQGGHIQTQTSDASIIGYLNTANSSLQLTAQTNHPITFFTNNTQALQLSTSQNAVFAGSITTASPSGGTAQPFKIGNVVAGAPTCTGYLQIDISGVAYKLLAAP